MAQYKVPQDVEAEDKLIGPFSFRQFIYLGVAALAVAVGVGLWQIFPGLIIIPLPFFAFFLILALPLRKDQPMETYLTAVIRYFLKPHQRLWQPDGTVGIVTIVAPKSTDIQLTKGIGGEDAAARLGYLAQVVDTKGWATRGVISPTASMNDIAYAEAQQAEDILDESTHVARTFDSMIDRSDASHRKSVVDQFKAAAQETPVPDKQPEPSRQPGQMPTVSPVSNTDDNTPPPAFSSRYAPPSTDEGAIDVDYNPYPNSMHQHVISPVTHHPYPQNHSYTPPQQRPESPMRDIQATAVQNPPSQETVSPDIIRLANNNDLSISAIANEAHRIEDKDNEEVVINLH